MRVLIESSELGGRRRAVLRALVNEYIRTAQPVASDSLVRRYRLGVSSATVRSDLAGLEELGLLTHPHTSAGRVPTDRGYRFFIETLMTTPGLDTAEEMMVRHQFGQVQLETIEWLRLAASVLARLTASASLVTMPQAEESRVRHLEVVPVQDQRALLVVVLDGGIVRQQLLELPTLEAPTPRRGPSPPVTLDLRSLSARLRQALVGKTASEVEAATSRETGHPRAIATAVARALREQDSARALEVYHDGLLNLLRQPEFASSAVLRDMLGVIEDRMLLSRMLPAALAPGDVRIVVGGENPLETLHPFSLVFGRYGSSPRLAGYMAIVGPTRMDYARSIGAVRYVGTLMSELMRAVDA